MVRARSRRATFSRGWEPWSGAVGNTGIGCRPSVASLSSPLFRMHSAPTSPAGKYLRRLLRSRGERHFARTSNSSSSSGPEYLGKPARGIRKKYLFPPLKKYFIHVKRYSRDSSINAKLPASNYYRSRSEKAWKYRTGKTKGMIFRFTNAIAKYIRIYLEERARYVRLTLIGYAR